MSLKVATLFPPARKCYHHGFHVHQQGARNVDPQQRTQPNQDVRKYVYAYTPARYIWNPELDQRGDTRFLRAASRPLQLIDRRRAQEATSIVAISQFVRERIQEHWDRSCDVIYPPVDVEYFAKARTSDLTAAL